jgi:anti-anti-sigma factor
VLGGFGIMVSFADDEVVAAICGEVDLVTAPDLAGILDAVIDQGHGCVVLEMAQMSFMDASGLRVIASAAERLRPCGGKLVIRSAPEIVRRMLDITDLAGRVHFERADVGPLELGREGVADDRRPSALALTQ